MLKHFCYCLCFNNYISSSQKFDLKTHFFSTCNCPRLAWRPNLVTNANPVSTENAGSESDPLYKLHVRAIATALGCEWYDQTSTPFSIAKGLQSNWLPNTISIIFQVLGYDPWVYTSVIPWVHYSLLVLFPVKASWENNGTMKGRLFRLINRRNNSGICVHLHKVIETNSNLWGKLWLLL